MENKYWLVDTNDLINLKTTFIGYTINDEGEFFLNQMPPKLGNSGCFTCVEVLQDKIIIKQDFLGMQGIYYYQNEERAIFSNGYQKIVDYVLNLKNCPLSVDKDFCVQYIFSNEEPINMYDTILKEIKRLGKEFTIEINRDNKKVNFIENDYEINSIKVDSKEVIDILDKWYNRWIIIYRKLVKMNSPILLDLSGGMDSRICFGFFLNSNIDKNNVIIKRNKPKATSYKKNYDDWDISQEIMDKFDYNDRCNLKFAKSETENENIIPKIFEDFDNVNFGNTKICNYTLPIFSEPVFHINGIYGDRHHLGDMEEIHHYLRHKKVKFAKDMKKEDMKILADLMDKHFQIILKKFEDKGRPLFVGDFSFEYINRFFGAKIITRIFHNDISISPFHDSSIHKIQIHLEGTKNYYALVALIYTRYFKDLMQFRFQTDSTPRVIKEEEIKFAEKQCEKYPFIKKEYDLIPDLSGNKKIYIKKYDEKDVRNILEKRLKNAEKKFTEIFGKDYFDLAMRDLKNENIKLQNYLTPIVSICSILNKLNK